MGNRFSLLGGTLKDWPDDLPLPKSAPTFDPNFGFEVPRKKRDMIITEEEAIAMKIPPEVRGYCTHHWIQLLECQVKSLGIPLQCYHERHAWQHCLREDYILRMKEYERERRLRLRKMKLEGKVAS